MPDDEMARDQTSVAKCHVNRSDEVSMAATHLLGADLHCIAGMKRFAEEDALAWDQNPADAPASANHVQKRLQKRKGVEVTFDPQAHRSSSKQGLHKLAVPASSC